MHRGAWLATVMALALTAHAPAGAVAEAAASPGSAQARTTRTTRTARTQTKTRTARTQTKTRTSAAKKTAKKAAKKKRKRREVSRIPNRRTATNMPRGWRWPPSKAMREAGDRCTAALDAAGVAWVSAAREGKIVTPLVVTAVPPADEAAGKPSNRELMLGGIVYHSMFRAPPYPMDCHLALALTTHAPALRELGVRKVVFGSIFRFTKVRAYGKTKNVLSRHALGLAMDVVSFEDNDGVVHDVQKDYPAGDELLRAIEDALNGSGGFRTVLTPKNDPVSHYDHFHVEANVAYYDDERNLAALPGAADEDPADDGAQAEESGTAPAAPDSPRPGGAQP